MYGIVLLCFLLYTILCIVVMCLLLLCGLLLLCAAAEHVEKVVNKNISIVREHNDYCNRGDMVSQYTLSNLHEPSQ